MYVLKGAQSVRGPVASKLALALRSMLSESDGWSCSAFVKMGRACCLITAEGDMKQLESAFGRLGYTLGRGDSVERIGISKLDAGRVRWTLFWHDDS